MTQLMPLVKNRSRAQLCDLLLFMIIHSVEFSVCLKPDSAHFDVSFLEELGYGWWCEGLFVYKGPRTITIGEPCE